MPRNNERPIPENTPFQAGQAQADYLLNEGAIIRDYRETAERQATFYSQNYKRLTPETREEWIEGFINQCATGNYII